MFLLSGSPAFLVPCFDLVVPQRPATIDRNVQRMASEENQRPSHLVSRCPLRFEDLAERHPSPRPPLQKTTVEDFDPRNKTLPFFDLKYSYYYKSLSWLDLNFLFGTFFLFSHANIKKKKVLSRES